ncbi:hypothetical protein PR202_gb11536 [Eleusine coracana subsp. coracana]|uniref:Sodium/calcium exchanger membrane region domain-containing protein n=2 Tax=Eleusine coracana subsp. coracana TaxID=191504 RepID=A0AAV5EKH4_ELECO|nr:hypothetical protein PR202_gb11536 [Eleusine coracana subsp. coracana]
MALPRGRASRSAAAPFPSACFLLFLLLTASSSLLSGPTSDADDEPPRSNEQVGSCEALQSIAGGEARCRYLRSHARCSPSGYIDYLRLFYCGFAGFPAAVGLAALALWLAVLFYLLGDTASEYFCASLEGLSAALRLPPAVAGVTLLSLGNGAPDVFATVVSFAPSPSTAGGSGAVGLSSALGGALFVSTVVAGTVALSVAGRRGGGGGVVVEWRGFVRDLCFLLLALCYLLAVLLNGAVTVWVAASFVSIYVAYVVVVWTSHCCAAEHSKPLSDPLLLLLDSTTTHPSCRPTPRRRPPQTADDDATRTYSSRRALHCCLRVLCMPLYLPRRLTIPDIAAHRWSRAHAVASAALAPILLAATWAFSSSSSSHRRSLAVLLCAAFLGLALAVLAFATTDPAHPPRGRVPWLAAGFLMSVLWAYTLARELVALLVAIGYVVGVKASVLGVTVLAWGDSLGDLVSNVAMAVHGGPGGAQAALSACYAGPLFNTVVGLGVSMAMAAAGKTPEPFVVPVDAAAYEAVAFLGAAVAWAMFVVPVRGMRVDRVYGVGLLAIYLCFFAVRTFDTLGFWR